MNRERDILTELEAMFAPKSLAVIGASDTVGNIGGTVIRNLQSAGYSYPIFPVNPRRETVASLKVVASVTDIAEPIDLAVIVLPSSKVVPALEECAAAKVRAVLVLTSGFSEIGPEGALLQDRVKQIAEESGMRLCGPNCAGYINAHDHVIANFASFKDAMPQPGPVALISQSGGLGSYIMRRAFASGVRLGCFLTTGNEVDVNVSTALEYLVERSDIELLMVFAETIRDPAAFVRALERAAELGKPVLVVKAGRSEAAARAAMSHTASVVGAADVFDAVCQSHGAYVCQSIEEMVDAAELLQTGRHLQEGRLGILTTSGGAGVLLSDFAAAASLDVPEVGAESQAAMRAAVPGEVHGSFKNPVDVAGSTLKKTDVFFDVGRALANADEIDGIVVVVYSHDSGNIRTAIDLAASTNKAIAVCATEDAPELRDLGIPVYCDPQRTMRALGILHRIDQTFTRARAGQSRATPIIAGHEQTIGQLLKNVDERGVVLESDATLILQECRLPVAGAVLARSRAEAAEATAALSGRVALKIISYDVLHRSDVGGVRLNVVGGEAAAEEYDTLVDNVKRAHPEARIEGVLVQEMLPSRLELVCGMKRDPAFGPVVTVGLGGLAVEILRQTVLLPASFSKQSAMDRLATLADGRITTQRRGLSQIELESVAEIMVAVGDLSVTFPAIEEIDLNPVVVADGRARIADALMVVKQSGQ